MPPIVSLRLPLPLRVADRFRRRLARSFSKDTLFDSYRLDLGTVNAGSMLVVLGGYFVPTGPDKVVTFQDKQRAGEALLADFRWVSEDLKAVGEEVAPGTTFDVAPLSLRQVNFHRYGVQGDLATLSVNIRVNPPRPPTFGPSCRISALCCTGSGTGSTSTSADTSV